MPPFDPYEVLEVPRDADPVTVRRSYQRLARRLHPDLFPDDPEAERRFDEVARAYRILSDPELRRRWDSGALEAAGRRRRVTESGELPGPRPRGVPTRFSLESFLEVHAEWIAGEPGEAGEARGEDLTAELTLDFAEAVRGVTTSFSVQRERECEECGRAGEGRAEPLTGGVCERCAGRGVVVDLDRIRVRIPQGVDDGTRLRLPGKGNPTRADAAGPGAGEPGDLFLRVRVRPHPYFRRRGLDVLGDLPVTFAEAALGAQVPVPTLDGPVRARLPPGTSSGQKFRLRGRGVTLSDGRAGDHVYTVRIVVPERLDEKTRELIERLPREDPRAGLPKEPV